MINNLYYFHWWAGLQSNCAPSRRTGPECHRQKWNPDRNTAALRYCLVSGWFLSPCRPGHRDYREHRFRQLKNSHGISRLLTMLKNIPTVTTTSNRNLGIQVKKFGHSTNNYRESVFKVDIQLPWSVQTGGSKTKPYLHAFCTCKWRRYGRFDITEFVAGPWTVRWGIAFEI